MIQRYNRQIRYDAFGESGQHQLQHTHVMIMGAGALGSHCAELLTRMGVGKLTIIDMDIVEESNLHRQALYDEKDAAQMLPKVVALKAKLECINSEVDITAVYRELTNTNIEAIINDYQPHIIMDGMDHFEIRYLINEICHKYRLPWIYGAAVGSKGTVYGIDYEGPCLKCLLETIPSTGESCAINGVLPPVIYQVASAEVSELIRWVSGYGFSHKLLTMNCFKMNFKALNINKLKNEDCHVCELSEYKLLNHPSQSKIEKQCGDAFLLRFNQKIFDHVDYLPVKVVRHNPFAKVMCYKDCHMTVFKDGRMNVYGIENEQQARSLYEKFIKCLK